MKTSARFLAMLLAVVMIAGAALSVSAFDDVAGNKHANAINVLAQLKVIGGYEDGTFKPDQKVTRAEMAKLVYVLYTTFVDAGTGATAFADVAADNWAAGYIRWCSQKGIIGGYGNGTFGPTDNVTYDQALKMVAGVLGYNEWDSALWPTDVRMLALRTLNLGEELEDVNGNDQLTRAQVAQILYNALDEEMNEKKTVNVEITGGFTMPIEVAKKLAVDVWKFESKTYVVTSVNAKDDEITLDKEIEGTKTFELADLGLEAYEGKVEALKGLHLLGLYNTTKKEMLGGLTVLGSVVDGVEVKYNKALDTLTVDGVAYSATEEKDEVNIKVNGKDAFKAEANKDDVKEITDEVKALLDKAYMARAIDVDGDAKIDELTIVEKTAVKVTSIGKTADKLVTLKTLKGGSYASSVKSADITIEVKVDDILVVAELGGIYYAEKVEAVETYATKLNTKANKVTLNDLGEVKFADLTIAGTDGAKVTDAALGEDAATGYYVYNGEIILAEDIKTASEYTFAILQSVAQADEDELDETTMTYNTAYTATLIVDGKKEVVTLPATGTAIVVGNVDDAENKETNDLTAEAALGKYPADKKSAGQPVYTYTLVAGYETDKDGFTVITIDKAFGEDDVLVTEGAISYDADKNLYTVGDYKKVVLDDSSVIFYTQKKDATGEFEHIASYNKESITKKDIAPKSLEVAYVTYDEATKKYVLLAAFVKGEIKGTADGAITYENDGTLILYAPENSNTVVVDGEKYYEYTFLDNEKIENADAIVSELTVKDGATEVAEGNFYAYLADDENPKYISVSAAADNDTFKKVELKSIFENEGYVLEFDAAGMESIADDVTVWGLYVDEDGKEVYNEYKTLTVAELAEMLDAVIEYNEDEENVEKYTVDAILVCAEDQTTTKEEYVIKTIIVEIFEENEDGDLVSVNDLLFPELV